MMEGEANGPGPILCAHLLRRVDALLLDLLASLREDEWDLPTVAPRWKVRDVAAHLRDTASRKLSLVRDGWLVERTDEDLVALVNRLNREGVTVYRRLSPGLLISMLRLVCRESAEFHESLDPFEPAHFGVSWAGEEGSLNWFDTARELTERWHHQQQIRYATGREGLFPARVAACLREGGRRAGNRGAGRGLRRVRRCLANPQRAGRLGTGHAGGGVGRAHCDAAGNRLESLHQGHPALRGGVDDPDGRGPRSDASCFGIYSSYCIIRN